MIGEWIYDLLVKVNHLLGNTTGVYGTEKSGIGTLFGMLFILFVVVAIMFVITAIQLERVLKEEAEDENESK